LPRSARNAGTCSVGDIRIVGEIDPYPRPLARDLAPLPQATKPIAHGGLVIPTGEFV